MKTNNDYKELQEPCASDEEALEERFNLLIRFLLLHDIISEQEYLSFVEEI